MHVLTSYRNCGTLVFGRPDDPFTCETEKCLRRFHVPFEKLDSGEQRRRYPGMQFPDDFVYILDKTGGVLRADKMLQAFQVSNIVIKRY